jgi:hypothetical protein
MRKLSKIRLLSFACLAIAADAYADVSFHGYGQVVMGTTFSNNRTFPIESQGSDYHADPTFTPNSNFALQASAPLSSNISATAQILARGDNDFEPKFQWAYLKYQFNDTYALKAGRLQLPYYQYSDYQFVGEAYPWVLPPEAVYLSEASTFDGVNLSAEKNWGDWFVYMQTLYGAFDEVSTTTFSGGSASNTIQNHNLFGLAIDASYNDWLSMRFGVFESEVSLISDGSSQNPLTTLEGVAATLNAISPDAGKAFAGSNDPNLYYTAALQVTRNNWLVLAEFQGNQSIAGASGYATPQIMAEYLSVGYHFGKLLPIATVGHRNQWFRTDKIKDALPASAAPGVGGLYSIPEFRLKDYFYELGFRYDLTPTVALKLAYTFYQSHYKLSDYSEVSAIAPLFVSAGQPAPTDPPNANRLLAAITFSF